MINKALILLFLLMPFVGFTQKKELYKKIESHLRQRADLKLHTGLNFTTFRSDTNQFYTGTRPFIGTSVHYHVWKIIEIIGTADYSLKSSSTVRPYKKTENQYFEFGIFPGIQIIPDFRIHAGISYARILKSNEIINNGNSWKGIEKIEIADYPSELNVVAGAALQLMDNMDLVVNYTIPTSNSTTTNLQLGVSFALTHRTDKPQSYRRKKIEASRNQIKRLKSGVLLIRLRTSTNTINALRQAGKNDKADKLQVKQEAENKKIINAFKNYFSFCDVRFFSSNHSQLVKEKQFNHIFLNDSLAIDTSIKLDAQVPFLVAEFGYIEPDTNKIFSHYAYEPAENGNLKKTAKHYSTSTEIDFYALRIMDENFIQLNKPFPYYTRTTDKTVQLHESSFLLVRPTGSIFLPRTYEKTVARMSSKLEKFYYKAAR